MSLVGTNNEQKIWNFLKSKGLSDYGVAGLMGNLYAESALNPLNLQQTYEKKLGYTDASYTAAVDSGAYSNFVKDAAGYGLAQWTYWTRKQNLLEYAKKKKKSIGDLEMQLEFLVEELESSYVSVLSVLKNAKTVKAASDCVLTKYERPANQSASVKTKRAGYGQKYFDKYAEKSTSKEETTVSTKITTAVQLAAKLIEVAKNYKTLYVMGCFGAPMTAANKKRYIAHHSYNAKPERSAMINAASSDTFGFDCVCLIKGILWGWNGNKSKSYGGAVYQSNNVPDIGANVMITKCTNLSTDFNKIEVGEAVWMEGHIGVYVGDGLAVECTPAWDNKVQITACNCTKSGYKTRNWTKHGRLPYITYTGKVETVKSTTETGVSVPISTQTGATDAVYVVKRGDTLARIASKYGTTYKAIADYNGIPNPNLIRVGQQIKIPGAWTPDVGDIVNYNGTTHYSSSNSIVAKTCKGGKAKITAVNKNSCKHPYHLVRISGQGSTVYGWVDAGTFSKV